MARRKSIKRRAVTVARRVGGAVKTFAKSDAVRRAKESRAAGRAAAGLGAAMGAYAGARLHNRWRLFTDDKDPSKGMDAMPLVGGVAAAAAIVGGRNKNNPGYDAIAAAGGGAAGASLGMAAALDDLGLTDAYNKAVEAKKK